ncbi:1620_t:CDS:2, partial [Racocetra fulgida]
KTFSIEDTENAINYWTQERMLNAKPLHLRNSPPRFKNKDIKNTKKGTDLVNINDVIIAEDDNPRAVGALFMKNNGQDSICTASLIATDERNSGMTAAHCLTNRGSHSSSIAIPIMYIISAGEYDDYAAFRLDFQGTTPKDPVPIVTFGYPSDGDMD